MPDKPVSKSVPSPAAKPQVISTVAAPAAAKIVAPSTTTPAKPAVTKPPVVTTVPALAEGKKLMNDTINKAQDAAKTFASETTERATAMFGDMDGRAKEAMAKGSKAVEDMVEFSKGNLEAMVAAGRVAAKGAQDIAKYSADYGRKSIEDATATAKKFAGVKSPTEFFQLQSEVAKSSLDAFVGEASKFTENYLKLMGEVMQPVQNRVAVAVEKVKTTVAA